MNVALSPAIMIPVLLAVTAVTAAILALSLRHTTPTNFDATDAMADAHRAAAFWRASFVAYAAAAAWNFIVVFKCVSECASAVAATALLGIALVFGAVGGYANRFFAAADPLSPTGRLSTAGVPIRRITTIGLGIAAAVVVMLAGLSVALVHADLPLTGAALRERLACGRLGLISASVLLAVGVAEIYVRNDWPAHARLDGTNPAAIHGIAVTLATVSGALFSVFLLELYAPVVVIQEQWILKAAEGAGMRTGIDVSRWIEQEGLSRSSGATLVQILAIVAPSLTAIGLPGFLRRR